MPNDDANPGTGERNRWWARPAFGVVGFGLGWPLAEVVGWMAGDPAPTAGRLASRALIAVGLGLAYGFGGNWLASRSR